MKKMYIAVTYDLYCGEPEELMERATEKQPFTFYSGIGMALDRFEKEILATELNGTFDFTIPAEEAYGEYDDEAVITLEKEIFSVDGKIDEELFLSTSAIVKGIRSPSLSTRKIINCPALAFFAIFSCFTTIFVTVGFKHTFSKILTIFSLQATL